MSNTTGSTSVGRTFPTVAKRAIPRASTRVRQRREALGVLAVPGDEGVVIAEDEDVTQAEAGDRAE